MNTDEHRLEEFNKLTHLVIQCACRVSNTLGCGFLEKAYENALVHELRKAGLTVSQQEPIKVYYDGVIVGDYVADLVVCGKVLVELKAAKHMELVHEAQCLNYLRATGLPVCLLLNFAQPKLIVRRIVN